MSTLEFGIFKGHETSFGARGVYNTSQVDVPHDRMSFKGSESRCKLLGAILGSGPWATALVRASSDFRHLTRTAKELRLYRDSCIEIVGDSRGSAGHIYFGAWLLEPVIELYAGSYLVALSSGLPGPEFTSAGLRPKDGTLVNWSSKNDPPAPGSQVTVNIGRRRTGIVSSYVVQHGFLGFYLDGDTEEGCFFGNDIQD